MSSEIVENIETVIMQAQEIRGKDISHERLGDASNFREANNVKNELSDYVIDGLEKAVHYVDGISDVLITDSLRHIVNTLNKVHKIIEEVESLVEKGVHDPSYPAQKDRLSNEIIQSYTNLIKTITSFDLQLKVAELSDRTKAHKKAQSILDEINSIKEDALSSSSETKKILSNLQDKSMSHSVEESISGFSSLKKNHKGQETVWLWVFIVSSLLTIVAFYYVINLEYDLNNIQKSTIEFIKRLLMISVPAIFMKIALTKFNLERNLRIIYDHRGSVLHQYKNFESAIGDDTDAKNEFRLEVAKYIFSDPQTGYIGGNSNSPEFNVTPVINVVDKIGKSISNKA